jgi:hypothetical protein
VLLVELEVDGSPVLVVAPTVVEVVVVLLVGARVVEVVEVVDGTRPALTAGPRRRGGVVVEEIPATRLPGRPVVVEASVSAGTRAGASRAGPGAVRSPSMVPPPAPSSTATLSVAHRRSRLNRTTAPAPLSLSDDMRIGMSRPGFSGGRFRPLVQLVRCG